ncbi:hypothetical protein ACOQFL_17180 [Actinopolyspora sp. H202]|uniref:hypothetical protein n=1 Tax=Actinopolyspora sp. H202 TaxID=1500456 RepID=UPI003EE7F9EF
MSEGNSGTNDNKTGKTLGLLAFFGIAGLVLTLIVLGTGGNGGSESFHGDESSRYVRSQTYSGAPLSGFTETESRQLSEELAEEEQRYGICFGWKLIDGSDGYLSSSSDSSPYEELSESDYDQGSSRGPNTPASTCEKWVEVRATVAYTSTTSEQWSAVDLEVAQAPDSDMDLPYDSDFAELGITAERFIDAPVDTTGQAAIALPLLLTQEGSLPARPAESRTETRAAEPLPSADTGVPGLWRWVWLVMLGIVTVLGIVLGTVGVVRQRGGNGSDGPPSGPPGQGPPPGQQPPQPPPPGQSPGRQWPPQQ